MMVEVVGSRLVVFDGCGHWTTFEQPQRCAQEIDAFYAALR